MTPLGHQSQGVRRIAARALDAVVSSGEAAVFLSRTTRRAVAVPYTAPGYTHVLQSHAAHLVGVYRDDLAENDGLLEQLVDDLCVHASLRRCAPAPESMAP